MKKLWKRTAAVVMALALSLSLAACGGSGVTAFDATKYIKGLMDETYLGVFDPEYMKMVEITEAEAEETYLTALEAEAEYFADQFNVENLTDEIKADIIALYKEIYAKSKYTVAPATKVDDATYAVKVLVEPMDIFHLMNEDLETYMAEFWETYPDEVVNAMTDDEYNAYDAEWASLLIALCREKLPEMGYLEETSLLVQMTKDAEDVWSIPDEDFSNLDWLIIDYNF